MSWSVCASSEIEDHWIESQIEEFNRKQLSYQDRPIEVPKNYVVKEDNEIIAGIKSCFYLDEVLSIGVLFVEEEYRHQGIGSLLLNKVEREAKTMGAKFAHLYTFDFQAKDFYLKHGYEIFGVLENCPTGHQCYYLKKNL